MPGAGADEGGGIVPALSLPVEGDAGPFSITAGPEGLSGLAGLSDRKGGKDGVNFLSFGGGVTWLVEDCVPESFPVGVVGAVGAPNPIGAGVSDFPGDGGLDRSGVGGSGLGDIESWALAGMIGARGSLAAGEPFPEAEFAAEAGPVAFVVVETGLAFFFPSPPPAGALSHSFCPLTGSAIGCGSTGPGEAAFPSDPSPAFRTF